MQQTSLDRWLRETLIHETHVFTIQKPPVIPWWVKVKKLKPDAKNRFQFQLIVRNRKKLDKILNALRNENLTFSCKVINRRRWFSNLIDNPKGKSFTFRIIWYILLSSTAIALYLYFPRQLIHDAINAIREIIRHS